MISYYTVSCINKESNDVSHLEFAGRRCILATLEKGELCWFFIEFEEDPQCRWHRVRTSTVVNYQQIDEEDKRKSIEVETTNSIYTFTSIDE